MRSAAKLSTFDLTMIVVSLVIGMGIFKTPSNVAAASSSPAIFFGAWLAGGAVALCGALTYAEIGSRYPVTGGYYQIFSYGYHPALAFMVNGIILVSNAASTAAVALIGAEYVVGLLHRSGPPSLPLQQAVAIVSILLFYTVNLLGLRMSSRTQNLLMVVKIAMVGLLIMAVFFPHASHALRPPAAGEGGWWHGLRSFGIALIAVSFTYGGYQQTINFGGEVDRAPKVIPRAILTGILIILILYMAVNYAYVSVIGFDRLKTADSIAAVLAGTVFGAFGDNLFRVLLFFSVLAYVNVQLLSNPRVIFAMSRDRVLPPVFGRYNPKGVYTVALTAFTAVSVGTLFFSGAFDRIVNYIIFLDSIGMATSAATIFILRRRAARLDQGNIYVMKGYPLVPLIFIAAYLLVGASIIGSDPGAAGIGFCIFLGLFPVYKLLTRRAARQNSTGA